MICYDMTLNITVKYIGNNSDFKYNSVSTYSTYRLKDLIFCNTVLLSQNLPVSISAPFLKASV